MRQKLHLSVKRRLKTQFLKEMASLSFEAFKQSPPSDFFVIHLLCVVKERTVTRKKIDFEENKK